ncbi:MAG: OmpH family outer membrane protein [Planctomycetota bacterium]
MKSTFIKTLFFSVVALFLSVTSIQAQENAGRVAILDVAKVFKNNPSFEAQMKAIRDDADRLKASITQQQEQIKNDAQELTKYGVGTPERNQLEAQLEQRQTSLRTQARQSETQLLNREARIYFDTYQQMQTVVESIAQQYGLSLVLRFDSEAIDPTNRNEVIKGVNRAVVFHRKLDLTTMVTDQLNARMAKGGSAPALK